MKGKLKHIITSAFAKVISWVVFLVCAICSLGHKGDRKKAGEKPNEKSNEKEE